jgi:hypothetical protein
LLERSIVDRMVGAPERLVFEGAPVLDPPLAQDQKRRTPLARDGVALDTVAACPSLTIVELARLRELCAKEANRLAPESTKARTAFIKSQAERLVERTGMSADSATKVIERQCCGVLLPNVVLPFDDDDLAGVTVADVLADPERYEGSTLADPLEGVEYGRCKAKIMRRADGSPWIHSFAHGRTTYVLKRDAATICTLLQKAPTAGVADLFVKLVLAGDLEADQVENLRDLVAERASIGRRALERKLKAAIQEQRHQREREEEQRRQAERQDPRPRIEVPDIKAEWLPQMQVLNEVMGKVGEPEPPMRDTQGFVTAIRCDRIPSMHALTPLGANDIETDETRLPAPEHPLLTRLDEAQLAELIERYIEYFDPMTGNAVHLPSPFVKHFLKRTDGALPIVTAIATMPIVLPDGTRGLVVGRATAAPSGKDTMISDNDNGSVPSAKVIECLERDFYEFKGLTIGGGDVASYFVEDIGFLCDKLTELQAALWPLKSGTPRLAAFAEKLDCAAEHALDLHRVALRAAGGRITS